MNTFDYPQVDELPALELYEELHEEAKAAEKLIAEIHLAMESEKQRGTNRWADLYQKYVPQLRQMMSQVINDALRQELRELVGELFLEQTLPSSEIDSRSSIWEEEPVPDDEWRRDYEEVQCSIDCFERDFTDDAEALAVPVMMADYVLPEPKVRKHVDGDPLTVRIIQAYADLRKTSKFAPTDKQIEVALDGMTFEPLGEEDVWYEEGAITTTAIVQNETQMFNPEWEKVAEIRTAVQPLVSAIKKFARKIKRNFGHLETADLLSTISEKLSDEFGTQVTEVLEQLLHDNEYQNVYMVIAPLFVDGMLKDEILDAFPQFVSWVEEFGLDVLETAMEIGAVSIPNDVLEVIRFREFEDELSTPTPEKLLIAHLLSYPVDAAKPSDTRAYGAGYINAIIAGASLEEANGAGWRNWRVSKSKRGAQVYNRLMSTSNNPKQAWAAFYATGKIVGGDKDGLTILTDAKQETRVIEWRYVAHKIRNREMYVAEDFPKKKELMEALKKHNIPTNILSNLKA